MRLFPTGVQRKYLDELFAWMPHSDSRRVSSPAPPAPAEARAAAAVRTPVLPALPPKG